MPLHPDDDRAEAGPRVEPGVDERQLGRAV